ncbi:MAG: type II toxin-antitoxin system RelE/ParE family toxin [Algicola sp.]|nr:type II toxin-antitoxin system RelE/ParE family toxin [Algicola sp.]
MKVLFARFAQLELKDAIDYYEDKESGLGSRFKQEVKKAALRVAQYPKALPIERDDIRKCRLYKFPYKLLYSIEPDHILILAVSHQRRKPNYWVK